MLVRCANVIKIYWHFRGISAQLSLQKSLNQKHMIATTTIRGNYQVDSHAPYFKDDTKLDFATYSFCESPTEYRCIVFGQCRLTQDHPPPSTKPRRNGDAAVDAPTVSGRMPKSSVTKKH